VVFPKAFIFDVEGTLIDCAAQMIDCWEHTFTKAGHQISRSELQRYSGMDGEEMLRSLLPAASTTMRQVLLEEHGRSYRRDFLDKAKGFEGAHEVVARLHEKGHTIAIATTCEDDELRRYDQMMRVLQYQIFRSNFIMTPMLMVILMEQLSIQRPQMLRASTSSIMLNRVIMS